jgi:purine-binding chemotaxis protein CheW
VPSGPGGGVLTVLVSGRTLALPSGDVTEIVRPRAWTRVPNAPPGLLGLANLRGTVLPVVSLAALLGQNAAAPSRSQRIVVAGRRERVGFLVDAVADLSEGDADALDLDALLAGHFTAPVRRLATQATPLAAAPAAVEEDDVALVTLRVCGQDYALGLDQVSAILKLPAGVTRVAGEGDATLGLIAFQGEALPLVSLAALLGLPPEPDSALRIAVVPLGGIRVGLVSAGLDRVLRVAKRMIGPVPAILSHGRGETRLEGICHIDDGRRLVSLLAPERLFDEATTRRIIAQAAKGGAPGGGQMPAQQASGRQEQFVVFVLGGERYGLPIAAVDEVVQRPASLTRVPRAPSFVEGVMNLRGRVVPVINQASRFAAAAGPGGRVIIVTIGGLHAGFAVDTVTAMLSVDADLLQPAPGLSAGPGDVFDRVALEDGAMTLLIDPAALLDQAERELLAAITPGSQAA